MPVSFTGSTADEAWRQAAGVLLNGPSAKLQDSRGGKTRELLHVSFYISNPLERWVLSREPAINPAFAIAEVLWILAGRDDSQFINYWNPALPNFAGRGDRYHGAYGYRLRRQFGFDQIERAYSVLDKNPASRQVVLALWDSRSDFPTGDGSPGSEDVPCNVCSMLKVREGRLDWMQIMRSNDLLRGTPHNFVQFTMLQEIMAGWLGLDVGEYVHISDSLHVYDDQAAKFSMANSAPSAVNRDRLTMLKVDFDAVLHNVLHAAQLLTSPNLSSDTFVRLCAAQNMPEGYRNLVLIMAADAARRRNWAEEMDYAASNCTNPVLQIAWTRWARRKNEQ